MAVLMCIGVIALFSILPGVQLQTPTLRNGVSSCARPSQDIFGSFDSAGSDGGIVARYFGAGDGGETPETVRIVAVNMVCEASGLTNDSLSSISAIVQYECLDSGCGGMNMIFTDQYRLDCIEDSGVTSFSSVVNGNVRTAAADGVVGTLTTPLDVQCSQCVSPTALRLSDPASYCLACHEDCTGLGLCLGTDADQCCNYYNEGDCVITCPGNLVPNSDFDCVFNCGTTDLISPDNGQVTGPPLFLDSVVSYTCDSGYTLVGNAMRTCLVGGWNGTNPICVFDCGMTDLIVPVNGQLTVDSTLLDSVASYTCDSGYILVGDAMRTCTASGWSGGNPICELTSEAFTFAVTFANCETSVMCSSSNTMGTCMVQIENQDQDFSQEVSGPLNSPIVIPLAESTQFNFQATATIDSIATTQERNFTTGEFASRLTTPNTALLILGVIFLSMAAVGCIILVIVEVVSCKGSWLSLVMLVVGIVLIVVSVVLLVAMGSHVGTRDNTCDSSFQETRNGLIIAAFVFSVLAVIFIVGAAIALAYSAKHQSQKNRNCLIDSRKKCRVDKSAEDDTVHMSEKKSPSPE